MKYSDKLKDPRWQKKRLEILERDNWTCQKCMDKEITLHVHHLKYNGNPWELDEGDLITLCKHCHEFIENEKARDMKIFKWSWEDGILRVANNISKRVDRLKGLGNAIVPQVAYQIFKAIVDFENKTV